MVNFLHCKDGKSNSKSYVLQRVPRPYLEHYDFVIKSVVSLLYVSYD